MTAINQDLIKAREVVAGYKELNKNTVEEVSYYDPVLKLRRYRKVQIDPNSKDFVKLYGKKKNEKKEKPKKAVKFVEATIDKTPPKKVVKKAVNKPKKTIISKTTEPKIKKQRYTKVTERKPRRKTGFDPHSLTSKIYDMYEMGVEIKEIASYYSCERHYVTSRICARKKALGIEIEPRKTIDKDLLEKLVKEGKTALEIAKIFNVSDSSIYSHIKRLKSDNQKEIEIAEVLSVIKSKCKLNNSNVIFSKMIAPTQVKYKNFISKMEVYKYCNILAERCKIIIPDEPISEYRGRKICLPIA